MGGTTPLSCWLEGVKDAPLAAVSLQGQSTPLAWSLRTDRRWTKARFLRLITSLIIHHSVPEITNALWASIRDLYPRDPIASHKIAVVSLGSDIIRGAVEVRVRY